MMVSQYKETCEELLDYPIIGGDNIKYFVKKSIGNLLHANNDVHSRSLIAELPGDGVEHCSNINFAEKVVMTGLSTSHT